MADSPLAFQAGRAAMYVRMSTEHQQYSTENQADTIRKYADQHNFSIVKTFVDHGKSGVKLFSRTALIELLREAESGTADSRPLLSTTSVVGDGFKTPMKAPTTSTCASDLAFSAIVEVMK